MASNDKPGPSSGNNKSGPSSSSEPNGIAYSVPALPNLMNGSGSDPKQRLPSFKNTRKPDDLTKLLGKDAATLLANKSKDTGRKFMPKLAPKPKPQPKAPAKKADAKGESEEGKQKGRPDRKDGRDGKKGNFRPRETIQTTGSVFDTSLQFEKKVRSAPTTAGATQRVAKPTMSAADRGKQLKERKKLQEQADENGEKKPHKTPGEYLSSDEDDDVTPLGLPMNKTVKMERPFLGACDFDIKPQVKDEPFFNQKMETSSAIVMDVKPTVGVDVPVPPGEEKQEDPSDIRPFWEAMIHPNSAPQDFFSIQFPDFIPVSEKMMRMRNSLAAEEQQQIKDEKLKGNTEGGTSALTDNPVGAYKLSLKDIPEGMFCRFRLRRSGKAELVFPSGIAFPVILGCGIGFKQDVCAIESGEADGAAKMTMLGSLRDKLVCVPNFEDIVAKNFAVYDAPPVKVEIKPEKAF